MRALLPVCPWCWRQLEVSVLSLKHVSALLSMGVIPSKHVLACHTHTSSPDAVFAPFGSSAMLKAMSMVGESDECLRGSVHGNDEVAKVLVMIGLAKCLVTDSVG